MEIQAAIDAIEAKEKSQGAIPKPVNGSLEEKKPIFPRNSSFPALHRGLTVKYDSARGRHVVATEHIKCGTYLAMEVKSNILCEYEDFQKCSYVIIISQNMNILIIFCE